MCEEVYCMPSTDERGGRRTHEGKQNIKKKGRVRAKRGEAASMHKGEVMRQSPQLRLEFRTKRGSKQVINVVVTSSEKGSGRQSVQWTLLAWTLFDWKNEALGWYCWVA